jgi:hypothetical protein
MADISVSRVSDCVINGTVSWDFATVQPNGMKTELVEVQCRVNTVWRQSVFNVSACIELNLGSLSCESYVHVGCPTKVAMSTILRWIQ